MPQTESLQIRGYLLKIREDFLLNSSFAEILTDSTLLEVKLPTKLENYKYKSFLNFGNLISLDLIKTRKHWIVTHMECYEKLSLESWSYHKFEVLWHINKHLCANLHLDQECNILTWLRSYLQKLDKLDQIEEIATFEKYFLNDLEIQLGFKTKI